jgi:hypothetical protein
MRIGAVIGLLASSLLILPTSAAVADTPEPLPDEEVVIMPYDLTDGDHISVTTDQAVTIQLGWGACTPGLARAFGSAAVIAMSIDYQGTTYAEVGPPAREYWTQLGPIPGSAEECVMQTDTVWGTAWSYELGPLSPGDYQVAFAWTLAHRYTDGGDYSGDGTPDPLDPNDLIPVPVHFTIGVVAPT